MVGIDDPDHPGRYGRRVNRRSQPLGAVLAGGAGERLGGSKATAELAGRPLISYPLAAFADAGIEAVVVAKASTALPPIKAAVVVEPAEPRHPLVGLVAALAHAGGRPIVSCPCDTPLVSAALLRALAASPGTAAVHDGERLHPLLARYRPSDLPALERALAAGDSATAAAESLPARLIQADARQVFNVNTREDLAQAASIVTRAL
jgi:molybdopterin-guanine dinucleotide biosynthesis protein A